MREEKREEKREKEKREKENQSERKNQNQSHPIPWSELSTEQVLKYKNVFCQEYNSCLSKMIKIRAKSWTCIFCRVAPEIKNAERLNKEETNSETNSETKAIPAIPAMFTL